MAEDRNREENIESEDSGKASSGKEKKKRRKKGLVILALLLVAPASIAGLHFSGVWDGRPILYSVVPKLPYVGESLTSLLDVPKEYVMTSEQRRIYELRRWEDGLVSRERELGNLKAQLDALSSDLSARALEVSRAESDLALKEKEKPSVSLSEEERKLFDRVVRTYQEISASKAAKIVENLETSLAVRILRSMPEDAGANILGRMDAAKAAWLTEQLAK